MSKKKTNTYQEPFDMATIPTRVLMKAARQRNDELRKKFGRYSAQKKLEPCDECGKPIGVRERRRHKCKPEDIKRFQASKVKV